MKVLWLCNTVPPEICEIFRFRKRYYEGWITGMLDEVKSNKDIILALCLPIRNPERMADGNTGCYRYYSFLSTGAEDISEDLIDRFCEIINDFAPDVVHIWGSEYGQSLAMVRACGKSGISNKTVVHIQGLISAISPYFAIRIPADRMSREGRNGDTIANGVRRFEHRGANEIAVLSEAGIAIGRTDWDRSYIRSISDISYRHCGEILRKEFYQKNLAWQPDECVPHSVFITQGGYSLKGIHLIIPAIAFLRKKYPDVSVWISGTSALVSDYKGDSDPYSEYLLSLMREYGVEDNIHFTGALGPEEMVRRYMKSNILAVTSTIENSSNSIGEAQLLGVPVVATYTGGTPSLVEHGKTGMLYQMDAPYMFTSCVERIFDDEEFSKALSESEKKVAKKRYDPKIVSKQLYDIYCEVSDELPDTACADNSER